MNIAISLSPAGQLFIDEAEESPSPIPEKSTERIRQTFDSAAAAGLLHLATAELQSPLPPTLAFWRAFASSFLTHLCHIPEFNAAHPEPVPAPPTEELDALAASAPPMRGLEYLDAGVLLNIWNDLDHSVREEIRDFPGGAQEYLKSRNPLWNLVGRVSFHLAENKRDEQRPFAFLATYATRLSRDARLQYLPLGRALEEYSGARNRNALLSLLAPVQRAAEQSPLARRLVDSGEVFHPLAWSPREAYAFLKEIPIFEASGILVRVPDWWKAGRSPRPQVSISIGNRNSGKLGLSAMLDFSVDLSLDGETISEQEWQALRSSTQGLVLLKGRWVEVDHDRLAEVLSHWKKVQQASRRDGISFIEAMRLLSGAGIDRQDTSTQIDQAREWSHVEPGAWLREILEELRSPAAGGDDISGPDLLAELRPYQQVGVRWLWFLYRMRLGGCLADDMGLGKTLQILALLTKIRRERAAGPQSARAPGLIVVPASLLANWKAEIAAFAPSLTVLLAHASENPAEVLERVAKDPHRELADYDAVITTYGMLHQAAWIKEYPWNLVVLDEAQAIKNPGTRQTRLAKELQAQVRLALTGTPVENRLSDLWSLFDFLNPGLLGSAKAFGEYVKKLSSSAGGSYAPLRTLVRPYILRRLKTDRRVIADLPDKTELRAFCSLSRAQAALYQQSVEELSQELESADGIRRRGIVLAFLMRFKQICNHPAQWLGTGAYDEQASGKFRRLREICEEIASRQEKVLIFSQFREVTGPLAGFLEQVFRGPGLVLHGGTPVRERRGLIDRFQSVAGPPFFVLSLKAGGTGLNLTAASHVIHFDRWWNPAVENQATDRAFRIGQKKNVLVHKFVCRGTVEDKIDAMIEAKKSLATELLEGGVEKLLTEMNNDELLRLVTLDLKQAMAD
jgi:non-specific serine/threonine protein kinase